MAALFESFVTNNSQEARIVGTVNVRPGERKVAKFFNMSQLLFALAAQRRGDLSIESDVPSELISDFLILSIEYAAKQNQLVISIHGGHTYIEEKIVSVCGVDYAIDAPEVNSTYFLFLDNTGTFIHRMTRPENKTEVSLWKIVIGKDFNNIVPVDIRYFITKDNAARLDDAALTDHTIWSSQKTKNVLDTGLATKSDVGHTHLAQDVTDFDAAALSVINSVRGQVGGIASLGVDGMVPIWQLPAAVKELQVKANIAERDAMEAYDNLRVHVLDASDDPTVDAGWAEYYYSGGQWYKVAEQESMDIVLSWDNLVDGPASRPTNIDDAVTKRHTHTNLSLLEFLTDVGGQLNYKGMSVAEGLNLNFQQFLNNGGSKKTIVFVIPRVNALGPQLPEIRFPFFGSLIDVSASIATPGEGDTEIAIERCADFDYDGHNTWANVLSTNITVPSGSRVIDTSNLPVIDTTPILSNDYFRVNVLSVGDGASGLTIEVTIKFYEEE